MQQITVTNPKTGAPETWCKLEDNERIIRGGTEDKPDHIQLIVAMRHTYPGIGLLDSKKIHDKIKDELRAKQLQGIENIRKAREALIPSENVSEQIRQQLL